SAWAYPTAAASYARFFDFGNGEDADNLVLSRTGTTDNLHFSSLVGAEESRVSATGAIALNQWQFFAVTVSGLSAKLYRNGALVASGTLKAPIANTTRASN